MLKIAALLVVLLIIAPSSAKPKRASRTKTPKTARSQTMNLHSIQTLHANFSGDAGFGRNLRAELERAGLRFVPAPEADALLDAHGESANGGFVGTATLRARDGRVLWTGRATREAGDYERSHMAFSVLGQQLRAALKKD